MRLPNFELGFSIEAQVKHFGNARTPVLPLYTQLENNCWAKKNEKRKTLPSVQKRNRTSSNGRPPTLPKPPNRISRGTSLLGCYWALSRLLACCFMRSWPSSWSRCSSQRFLWSSFAPCIAGSLKNRADEKSYPLPWLRFAYWSPFSPRWPSYFSWRQ